MREVQIYIEGERDSGNYSEVELFNDESINLSLSVQNIQDISKVFTDFSQSFTVPASTTNNSIFKHFYENSIDLDPALIDQRLKRNAYIEIDRTPFRNGKIQLEKANLKDGEAQSYSITFYGDLVTLKDTFSDDKLSDLDYSNVDNPYSFSDVKDRVSDGATDFDVRYPLISSDRVWSYGDSTSTDISNSAQAINYRELFPAVKVSKIFEAIENKYNVNFRGLFLSDERFTDLFLWCKNSQTTNSNLQNQSIDLVTSSNSNYKFQVDLVNNSVRLLYGGESIATYRSTIFLTCFYISDLNAEWTVDVYVNGALYQSITRTGVAQFTAYTEITSPSTDALLTFQVRSDEQIDIQFIVDWEFKEYVFGVVTNTGGADGAIQTIDNSIDLALSMPDIKVSDFFSGVLKQFNLTCYPLSINTFEVEPLDYWYQKGALNDITNFVDVDSIDVAKVPLYKRVSLEHEKSKSFLNEQFLANNRKEYGDLKLGFDYDGSDFTVKLPFENLLQTTIDDNLQVGYSLEGLEELKPYIPKPIMLYKYDQTTVSSFWLTDGISSTDALTTYTPMGTDALVDGLNYSLNFGQETSALLETSIPYSVYSVYYQNYIGQLFSYKNRLTSIKANFPVSLITNLKLNDRLIIRDKRYIINNIKTNLTSGEVDLELLNDFNAVSNANVTNELEPIGGVINVPVLVENNVEVVNVSTPTVGITLGGTTTFTTDGFLEVTYPTNPNGGFERITEDSQERVTERITTRRSENGSEYIIEIELESIYFNGEIKNESLFYIQGL